MYTNFENIFDLVHLITHLAHSQPATDLGHLVIWGGYILGNFLEVIF